MIEPKKLIQKECYTIRLDYEKRYGYDSRSDEEKDNSSKSITKSINRAIQKMTIPVNRVKKLRMNVSGNVMDVASAK